MKRYFCFSKYEICSKSNETEAVFTKTDMNNEWNVIFFFSKYEICSKSNETEAVFTKTDMNNEWNVNFVFQNTRSVQKAMRLKLYLWTMNETLIFFSKYEICSKSNETEAVFTKTEMNNEWSISFLSKYEIFWKSFNVSSQIPVFSIQSQSVCYKSNFKYEIAAINPAFYFWFYFCLYTIIKLLHISHCKLFMAHTNFHKDNPIKPA